MASLFDVMPGSRMDIRTVSANLSEMWKMQDVDETLARASQMNVILHFGLDMEQDMARKYFEGVLRLGQKFPCRILALCPYRIDESRPLLEAKLFCQCELKAGLHHNAACEAIMLGYAISHEHYLENQLSIWLENDLPTYYWVNHLLEDVLSPKDLPIMKFAARTIYDSGQAPHLYRNIYGKDVGQTADLGWYRTLPIRQPLGQFFSGYRCSELTEALEGVEVRHQSHVHFEAQHVLNWLEHALQGCSKLPLKVKFSLQELPPHEGMTLSIKFNFTNGKEFGFTYNEDTHQAQISASLYGSKFNQVFEIHEQSLEETLQAALFF